MSYEKTFDLNYGMVSWPADTSTSPQEPMVEPVKELGFVGAEFATESDNPPDERMAFQKSASNFLVTLFGHYEPKDVIEALACMEVK